MNDKIKEVFEIVDPTDVLEDMAADWYDLWHKQEPSDSTLVDIITYPFDVSRNIVRLGPSLYVGGIAMQEAGKLISSGAFPVIPKTIAQYGGLGITSIGTVLHGIGKTILQSATKIASATVSKIPSIIGKTATATGKVIVKSTTGLAEMLAEVFTPILATGATTAATINTYLYNKENPGHLSKPNNLQENIDSFKFKSNLLENPIATIDKVLGVTKTIDSIVNFLKGGK